MPGAIQAIVSTVRSSATALVETLVDRTAGTVIDNASTRASAAFDGVTNQGGAQSAIRTGSTAFYIGKNFSAGKIFSKAVVYGSNNAGFTNTGSSITINIRGKNSNPSGSADGTLIGTITFTDTSNESGGRIITSTDTSNTYSRIWVEIPSQSQANSWVAELVLYELL